MAHKMFDAFQRAFDEKKKAGLSNNDAFEKANDDFRNAFQFSPYKDTETFVATRSYHRKEERKRLRKGIK